MMEHEAVVCFVFW